MIVKEKRQYLGLANLVVPVVDTTRESPDYLRLDEVPTELTAGKNYLKILGNPNVFKRGTPIVAEVIDASGNTVYIEYPEYYDSLKRRLIVIDITDETAPGPATLTICTVLNDELVPARYINALNFKWQIQINVAPFKINTTPIIYVDPPVVELQTRVRPYITTSYRNGEEMITKEYGDYEYMDYTFDDYVGSADASNNIFQKNDANKLITSFTSASITSFDRDNVFAFKQENYSARSLVKNYPIIKSGKNFFYRAIPDIIQDPNFESQWGTFVNGDYNITAYSTTTAYNSSRGLVLGRDIAPVPGAYIGIGKSLNLQPNSPYLISFNALVDVNRAVDFKIYFGTPGNPSSTTASISNIGFNVWTTHSFVLQNYNGSDLIITNGETTSPWSALSFGGIEYIDNVRVLPLVGIETEDFKLDTDMYGGYVKVHNPINYPVTESGYVILDGDPSYKGYLDFVLQEKDGASANRFNYSLIDEEAVENPTSYFIKTQKIDKFSSKSKIGYTILDIGFTDLYRQESTVQSSTPMLNGLTALIVGPQNKIYGCSYVGGQFNNGALYSYDVDTDTFNVLFSFTGKPGGKYASHAPLYLKDGANPGLYGVTLTGGVFDSGSIYRYNTTTGVTSIEYSFGQSGRNFVSSSGILPNAPLMQASNGLLYGLTQQPSFTGASYGVLFSFNTASKAYTRLVTGSSFGISNLIESGGLLWGTTEYGGGNNAGSIFAYNISTNTLEHKHDFDTTDEYKPQGLTLGSDGKFYGVTQAHFISTIGGVIFSYSSASGYNSEHILVKTTSGSKVEGYLYEDSGYFYGAASEGGSSNKGTVFRYSTSSGQFNLIYTFTGGSDGQGPKFSFVRLGGSLYNTTVLGGFGNRGTIFRLDREGYYKPYIEKESGTIYHHNAVIPRAIPATSSLLIDYPRWTGPVKLAESDLYSIVELTIKDLEPISGDVSKLKLSAKPAGIRGEFTDLGVYSTKPVDVLLDNNFINHVPYVDSAYRLTGYFKPVISNFGSSTIEANSFRNVPFLKGWVSGSITNTYFTDTVLHTSLSIQDAPEINGAAGSLLRMKLTSTPVVNGLAYCIYTGSKVPPGLVDLDMWEQISYNVYSAVPFPGALEVTTSNWYTSSMGYNHPLLNNVLVYSGLVTKTSSLSVSDIYAVSNGLSPLFESTGSTFSSSIGSHPLTFNGKLGWKTDLYLISASIASSQSLYPALFFEYNTKNNEFLQNTFTTLRPNIIDVSNFAAREIGDRQYMIDKYWRSYTRVTEPNYSLVTTAYTPYNTDKLIDSVKLSVLQQSGSDQAVGYLNKNAIVFESVDSFKFIKGVPYIMSFNAFSQINTLNGRGDKNFNGAIPSGFGTSPGWGRSNVSWSSLANNYFKFNFATRLSGSIQYIDGDYPASDYIIQVNTGQFTYSNINNPTSITISWGSNSQTIQNVQPFSVYTFIMNNPSYDYNGPSLQVKASYTEADADIYIIGFTTKRYNYNKFLDTATELGNYNISSILPANSKLKVYGINTSFGVPFADQMTTNEIGEFIGELEHKIEYNNSGETKNFGRVEMEFASETDGFGKIAFQSDLGADWYISDISIKAKDRVGLTPGATRLFIKLPNDLVNKTLTFKVEYLNDVNEKSSYVTLLNDVRFTNKDESISGDKDALNTSTTTNDINDTSSQGPNETPTGDPGGLAETS